MLTFYAHEYDAHKHKTIRDRIDICVKHVRGYAITNHSHQNIVGTIATLRSHADLIPGYSEKHYARFVKTDELAAAARERSVAMIYASSRSNTITEIAEHEANPENHQVACLRHTEHTSPSISRGIATLILGLAEKGHPNRQRNIFKGLKSAITKCASRDTFILLAAAITHYLPAS